MTLTEVAFRAGSLQLAQLRPDEQTYLYEFGVPNEPANIGAGHAVEIPTSSTTSPTRATYRSRRAQRMADAMHGAWVAFAKTGDPGWAPYLSQDTVQRFDWAVLQTPDAAQYAHGYRFRPHTQCRGHRGGEFDRSSLGDRATADPGGRGLLVTMLPWCPTCPCTPSGSSSACCRRSCIQPQCRCRRWSSGATSHPSGTLGGAGGVQRGCDRVSGARTVARRVVVDGDRDRRHRLADRRGGHADDQKAGAPSRIVAILEGESLLNDATALVLLRTAIAAAAAGVSVGGAFGDFVWSVPS